MGQLVACYVRSLAPSLCSLRSAVLRFARWLRSWACSLTSLTPSWDRWSSWICFYTVNSFHGKKHVFGGHEKHTLTISCGLERGCQVDLALVITGWLESRNARYLYSSSPSISNSFSPLSVWSGVRSVSQFVYWSIGLSIGHTLRFQRLFTVFSSVSVGRLVPILLFWHFLSFFSHSCHYKSF